MENDNIYHCTKNAPPIFLLKMKNYFLNCVVEEILCNRVYVGSPREKEPHPPPRSTEESTRQKIGGLTRIDAGICFVESQIPILQNWG